MCKGGINLRSDTKILIFSFLVFAIIISTGAYTKALLQKNTNKFNSDIKMVQLSISIKDWKTANKYIDSLNKNWQVTENTWALFINHHEIDNISSSLCKATQYIHNKCIADSFAYLEELKEFISHIPDMEKLSLKNIL